MNTAIAANTDIKVKNVRILAISIPKNNNQKYDNTQNIVIIAAKPTTPQAITAAQTEAQYRKHFIVITFHNKMVGKDRFELTQPEGERFTVVSSSPTLALPQIFV